MQRWYTKFPQGLPGVGLLCLRTAIGVRLIIEGSAHMLDAHSLKLGVCLLGALTVGTGVALVLGFLTPLAAWAAALTEAAVYLLHPGWAFSSVVHFPSFDTIVAAIAIGLLGPGAISLDAWFFGRRKIVIPRVARS